MKKLLLAGLSVIAISTSAFAQDSEMSAEELSQKLTLAREYSKTIPVETEVQKAIDNIIVRVPKEDRVLFKSILERTIKTQRLKSVSEMALAETFTVEELEAMVAFYKTPEGKAIREKMPEYQAQITPVLEQMLNDAIESYQRQVN